MTRADELTLIEEAIAAGKMKKFPYMLELPIPVFNNQKRFARARMRGSANSHAKYITKVTSIVL